MSDKAAIIARLAKLRALSSGSSGGESEAADLLMRRLAERHGIDLADIDDEAQREWPLDFKAGWRLDLFLQIAGRMRYDMHGSVDAERIQVFRRRLGRKRSNSALFVRCTESEWIELEARFSVLSADYARQLAAFPRAFMERNDLLLPFGAVRRDREPSAEELELAKLAGELALGMRRTVLAKQIEGRAAE